MDSREPGRKDVISRTIEPDGDRFLYLSIKRKVTQVTYSQDGYGEVLKSV